MSIVDSDRHSPYNLIIAYCCTIRLYGVCLIKIRSGSLILWYAGLVFFIFYFVDSIVVCTSHIDYNTVAIRLFSLCFYLADSVVVCIRH